MGNGVGFFRPRARDHEKWRRLIVSGANTHKLKMAKSVGDLRMLCESDRSGRRRVRATLPSASSTSRVTRKLRLGVAPRYLFTACQHGGLYGGDHLSGSEHREAQDPIAARVESAVLRRHG